MKVAPSLKLSKVLTISKKAISSNAIYPLETTISTIDYSGSNEFELRLFKNIYNRKKVKEFPQINPFKPWDKRLELKKIKNDHVLILNKYPVQIGHMLLITKNWQPQNGWLSLADFYSLRFVESQIKGLWFFNSCSKSGASQPHRHIQLLYRKENQQYCPRENWFQSKIMGNNIDNSLLDNSCKVTSRHLLNSDGNDIYEKYLHLAEQLGLGNPLENEKPLIAYNMLITSDWIAIIRRSSDSAHGFEINALGFAGYLIAYD